MNFKEIHIGQLLEQRVGETKSELSRICNFMHCSEEEIQKMYLQKSLDTEVLLKWSKILDYDFFRLYSQHMILYAPPMAKENTVKKKKSSLPNFRKILYTKEIINFILEMVESGKKTKNQVIEEYKIPKTTLYKWISKYKS